MADAKLSADIYDIAEFVEAIKQKYVEDETEDTLMMGIYGYMSSIFSTEMQNAIRIASQYSNEAIPTRAKFEKNILTHALSLGISSINATPARMVVLMCFPEEKLIKKMSTYSSTKDVFVYSKDVPIYIEGYEYHTDYDIEITKQETITGRYVSGTTADVGYVYSAKYIIDRENPISDITNPNLTSVRRISLSDDDVMVAIPLVTIRQVQIYDITRKILTENPIENKTINFEFDDQLADFFVEVVESGSDESLYLTPIYEGLYTDTEELYCNYTYINENSIRIKFNSDSYEPTLNADITVHSYLTKGAEANFDYDSDVVVTLQSTEYDYSGLYMALSPATGSEYGADKKSIDTIKRAMAKEALARGSVTNTTDLENFFNSLSDENSKMYFYKKRHNLREVIYYAFVLLKNGLGNIIPTNTIDIVIDDEDDLKILNDSGDKEIVIRPGARMFILNQEARSDGTRYGTISSQYPADSDDYFSYISPFLCVIYGKAGYVGYYLTTMDIDKALQFEYINSDSSLQFVATYINWCRKYSDIYIDSENNDLDYDCKTYGKYSLTVDMVQNVNVDSGLIIPVVDKSGDIVGYYSDYNDSTSETNYWTDLKDVNSIVAIAAYYEASNSTSPLRYSVGELTNYDSDEYIYSFKFDLFTDDNLNDSNYMKIVNLKNEETDTYRRESLLKTNDGLFDFENMAVDENSYVDSNSSTYFHQNMVVKIYVLIRENPPDYSRSDKPTDYENLTEILTITGGSKSGLKDLYTLTNIYEIEDGIDMYSNYTNIMESQLEILNETVTTTNDEGVEESSTVSTYVIRKVPLLKESYINPTDGAPDESELPQIETDMLEFIEALETKRDYIEYCIEVLEDALDIDLKFFNTYGPATRYYVTSTRLINRVDISLEFNICFINNSYVDIIDKIKDEIKEYIEDIEDVAAIHIPNIITQITTNYSEYITYFEFVSFNYERKTDDGDYIYGPGCQHISELETSLSDVDEELLIKTPEFLNVRNNVYGSPDIQINIV